MRSISLDVLSQINTDPPYNPIPEIALIVGVIVRALRDLESNKPSQSQDAQEWLNNLTNNTPFSFLWCCEELDVDPHKILLIISSPDLLKRLESLYDVRFTHVPKMVRGRYNKVLGVI